MRCTPASYYYTVRQVKHNEKLVIRERIANAYMDNPKRSIWAEVTKIRHGNRGNVTLDRMSLRRMSNRRMSFRRMLVHQILSFHYSMRLHRLGV